MRLFIAVPVSGGFLEGAKNIQELLKRSNADVKWVSLENMHFTMRFLGETPAERLDDIRQAVKRAQTLPAFSVSMGGAGAYPCGERPRVLWVGVSDGANALKEIADVVNSALTERGFPAVDRPFSPHLTLGRVRSPRGAAQLKRSLSAAMRPRTENPPALDVNSVKLIESVLGPKGPVYKTLFSSALCAKTNPR